VQVVVVRGARIEQDAGQLSEIVEALVHVDDRIEGEPAVPDILEQFSAGPGHGQVDVEGRTIRVG
jgi:hypothetical protein